MRERHMRRLSSSAQRSKALDRKISQAGVDFDAAWERRVESMIDPASGLKANFISAADLIAAKTGGGASTELRGCGRNPQQSGREPKPALRRKGTS